MEFIYDNMVASIIAATVTLMLITIQLRATQKNVARASRNAVKEEAQTFATWLEKDLERIGGNVDPDKAAFNFKGTNPHHPDSLTKNFVFYRDSVASTGDTVRIRTRYRVRKEGTSIVEGDTTNLYQLTRKKKIGSGSWSTVKGLSTPTLEFFKIDMLNKDAERVLAPETNPEDVRSIRVRFSAVAPYRNQSTILPVTHVGSVMLLRDRDKSSGVGGTLTVPQKKSDCVPNGWKVLKRPDGTDFSSASACKTFATGTPSASP
jgi:hypothetical protein